MGQASDNNIGYKCPSGHFYERPRGKEAEDIFNADYAPTEPYDKNKDQNLFPRILSEPRSIGGGAVFQSIHKTCAKCGKEFTRERNITEVVVSYFCTCIVDEALTKYREERKKEYEEYKQLPWYKRIFREKPKL